MLKIYLLSALVLVHGLFSVSTISNILLYSLGRHSVTLDILSAIVVFSFVIFKRCIMIDIYEYFRDGETNLPRMAKDNYVREELKSITKRKQKEKDLTPLRLDIITNIIPLLKVDNKDDFMKLYSRKINYMVINVIIAVILCIKYKIKYLIPGLLVWLFSMFPI